MVLEDFDQYSRISLNGDEFIVIMELPMQKLMCARVADIGGGADVVILYLMEKPV